ncbi:tRNA adenosine deaminase-associated protein [Streptomyces bambusae]|uniref:tRNA adenosine deaminase-associated protein n=1 Tax=Streptomyces bambusae TaxID=1550616 RepID=UPI001CFD6CE3|nr:tRNA adenosine deaminase-associated protein [Streptomyces bambusae]MCB5163814.1 tRNA adenosine deaminase-associated protein [Streptomyces bambusae]
MTEHKSHRYAVAVVRRDGRRQCTRLDRTALTGLDEAIAAVRDVEAPDGTVFGFFNADESFFLILRSTPAGTGLLLSDARAAHRHTLAAQALDVLGTQPPGEDAPDARPAGDLGIAADLGLTAEAMAAVLARPGALPDDQLRTIAEQCGFADEFLRVQR